MAELTIGYEFIFNVTVKKKNGKIYKSHSVMGIGSAYDHALWYAYFSLKKKKIEILNVNAVRVTRIAFAIQDGQSISVKLADHPPVIPEDLNNAVKYLPKS